MTFEQAKAGYRTIRASAVSLASELIEAREQVKRLAVEADRLRRTANADFTRGRLRALIEERQAAEERLARIKEEHIAAAEELRGAGLEFGKFADPTDAISQWPADIPIALMPLRLETRYRASASGRELMVRIYPDDILVDSFQPEISRAEFDNSCIYWTQVWRAGGKAEARKAAWLALAKAHGSGRAQWLTARIAPSNPADEPSPAPGEHVLVVRPPAPIDATEKSYIVAFWERVWSTAFAERELAFADLAAKVGEERAGVIERELAPANLFDPEVKPGPALKPRIAFLDLPHPSSLNLSEADWTRPAQAWLLPERFLLLGYRDGKEVLRRVGRPVPSTLQVGPDPSAEKDDQLRSEGANLEIPKALLWTSDFEDALDKGMAFRIDLEGGPYHFDRLFVLGLRLSSDATEGATECEELFAHHQASRKGLSFLAQGRPTNNTDQASAGYSWWEDPAEAYDHFHPPAPHADPTNWEERRDGAWLAGALGLDPELLEASPGYYGTDQAEARAMNVALWPATLGYYMEQMLEPVFSEADLAQTRDYFSRFVVGCGSLPLLRVGRQPYGVVAANAWSRAGWWRSSAYARLARSRGLPPADYLERLHVLAGHGRRLWSGLAAGVAEAGTSGGDAHQRLLDILGLHPASVEFYQRYSQTFTQYYNLAGFESDPVSAPITQAGRRYILAGVATLEELGWTMHAGSELPELLEKIFLKGANLLKGDLVSAELSERRGLPVTRSDKLNYIAWLQQAARTSHDALRKQKGFGDAPPAELLYLMLRHALDLGYVEAELHLRRARLEMNDIDFRIARKEPKSLSISQGVNSRWAPLYRPEPAVTGDPAMRVGDFIPTALGGSGLTLERQLSALDRLKDASTARLERAFVQHLDSLSYRFDAWQLSFQSVQLSLLRSESDEGFSGRGLHLGAYGWVEKLAPRESSREPVTLDGKLAALFGEAGVEPLKREPTNQGHIHAPSLDQAVAAAILRNGHVAHATPSDPDALAVDLSSERVRLGQELIEGMRNGQSLGALLGYRLERALHSEPDLYLDRLIYDLRKAFPLAGNRNLATKVDELDTINQVEARNVLDGAALVAHIDAKKVETYPYALDGLPSLSEFTGPGLPTAAEIGAVIDGHVAAMRGLADAVADLGIAEGVYQLVRGNHERAAGVLDAVSKGGHPAEIEVTKTPRSGTSVTHRVAIHLAGAASPSGPGLDRPREQGEPALASWLARHMPDPAAIFARVRWTAAAGGGTLTPSMAELGLSAADLFYLLDAGSAKDMAGFDDLLIDHAEQTGAGAHHDARFELEYRPEGVSGLTLFELAPLIRALRGTVMGARALRPSDLGLSGESGKGSDAGMLVRPDKVQAVRKLLTPVLSPVAGFAATLKAAVGPDTADGPASAAASANVDSWLGTYAALVRSVVPFGLSAVSLSAGIEGRRVPLERMKRAIVDASARWDRLASEYDAVMTEEAALPAAAADQKTDLLLRATGIISTRVIAPLPADVTALEGDVAALRTLFDTRKAELEGLAATHRTVGTLFAALSAFVPNMAEIDSTPFDLAALQSSVLGLARDLHRRAEQLLADVQNRIESCDKGLADAAAASGEKARRAVEDAARALLGPSFLVLPEFALPAAQAAEWTRSWNDRSGLLDHLKTGPEGVPYPLDDWLHGLGRVRERMRHLEHAQLLGSALGSADALSLEPLQFPHRPDDVWVGMRLPATFRDGKPFLLDRDKLLYTAHIGPGGNIDPADSSKTYCGLLVDEWSEVIPGTQETTGLAFHYDRPSNEAPQAILLVTAPELGGHWTLEAIVDAMHETLDLARLRAVEPAQIDGTRLGPLLPAILSAVTTYPITAMLNFAFNNHIELALLEADA